MAFRSSDSFADECLQSINRHRAKHQVSPLRLNAQISRVSQRWADGLARSGNLRHNDSAKHNGEELGENIAMRWSSDGKQFSGEDFVDQWYDEVKNYDFRKCSGNKTGHFTQLVWKGSAELGVGKAIGPDGKWMVVTNFYPAGNFLGEFQNNVFPPADGKIILKVSAPANAPAGRVSPRSTAKDFPHTIRPSHSPFIERQEVRRSPQQPTYVVTAPQSRSCNSPSSFSFLKPSASSSSSSTSPFKTTSSTAAPAAASSSMNNSTFVQRQVRTEREGGKTRTIVIETFRNPDGSTRTIQTESTSTENGDNDIGQVSRKLGAFQLNNNETSRSTAASARAVPAPAFSSFQSSPSPMSPWSAGRSAHSAAPSSGATSRFDGIGSQATSSGGGGGGGSSQREFNDDVIRNHNQYRRMHGAVGDLRLNNELCVVAQQWAERLASGRILQHSGASFRGKPMGENLACKYGTGRVDYTGKEVVKGWYDEIKDFNFRYPESSNLQAVGHFTQVVWKGSQEVGIGKAKSSDGAVFVVCNYIPAGNVIGRFKENVFPAK